MNVILERTKTLLYHLYILTVQQASFRMLEFLAKVFVLLAITEY